MAHRNRTPPVLEPYLQLPPELSVTLLTGTLGCNPSWLTARIVGSALSQEAATGVVLVSWMNEEAFCRSNIKRVTTIDVDKPDLSSRFTFVDRLAQSLTIPARPGGTELNDIEKEIFNALQTCPSDKILLVLEDPDSILATHPEITALELNNLLMKLRAHPKTHALVLVCIADIPRTSDGQMIPLEVGHAAFLTQQAHLAHSLISVRELETGSARDVSGILRITGGLQELERRYLVQRDGSVKIVE